MSKQLKGLMILTAVIFLAGIIGTFMVLRRSGSRTVEIVQDGVILYTINLETAENQEIVITSAEGSMNTVTIKDGEICISHAQCPDHTCVKMGNLYSESLPIVCLPNKLIVRYQ